MFARQCKVRDDRSVGGLRIAPVSRSFRGHVGGCHACLLRRRSLRVVAFDNRGSGILSFSDRVTRHGRRKGKTERGCAVKDVVEERNGLSTTTENRYAGYTVCDYAGEKIGKVEEFFVDGEDRMEYIGVRTDSLEPRSMLIPIDMARVNEQWRLVEIAASKEKVEDTLLLDDGVDAIPTFEQQVRGFFGVANDEVLEVPPVDWMVPFLLACLRERDCRGRDLALKVTDSGFGVSRPQAMYRALRRMEKEGVLVSEDDGLDRDLSRRRYSITELGDAYLEYLANALMQFGDEIDLFIRLYKQPAREQRLEHKGL